MNEPEIVEITPTELGERLRNGGALSLVDVREDHERAFCRIVAPEEIPDLHCALSRLGEHVGDLLAIEGPLVLYCHHGVRSMAVAQWLASQGKRDLINLEGGIDRWSRTVDPSVPRY